MSAFVTSLDNHTPIQYGENGHAEYGWSKNIQERIAQLHMQLTRTDGSTVQSLGDIFDSIIRDIQSQYNSDKISKEKMIDMLSVMYKMVGFTRDIIDGKGEYTLSYMLVYRWYAFYPELARFALKCFVTLDPDTHPFGSWKDIKYFCNYCKEQSSEDHPLIFYAIQLANEQIRNDIHPDTTKLTLAGKWVPREKSVKFGWLYNKLACDYFNEYIVTAKTEKQIKAATLKCFTKYREICSQLNKKLDTVQVKQCANEWAMIDPSKQTSITMHKQKKAFLNKNAQNEQRIDKEDRIQCANHFLEFINKVRSGEATVKGKRISLADFTKEVLSNQMDANEKDLLNAQWRDNSSQTGALGDMIAMVDVSGSMNGDPLHAAIALGCRIAEKSSLGKRVLTFSGNPTWVDLDDCKEFTDMVEKLRDADWGTNTDIYKAFELILNAIEQFNLNANQVSKMIFVILSDMQIDSSDHNTSSQENRNTLFSSISRLYAKKGIEMTGSPFEPPHLVFWNLRSTTGTPVLSTTSNVSTMSGFSPALLNLYCEKGLDALQSATPWFMLLEALSNKRYDGLREKVVEVLL